MVVKYTTCIFPSAKKTTQKHINIPTPFDFSLIFMFFTVKFINKKKFLHTFSSWTFSNCITIIKLDLMNRSETKIAMKVTNKVLESLI